MCSAEDPIGRYARREYERRWLLPALPAQLEPSGPWARLTDHYIHGTRFRLREYARTEGDVVLKLTQKFADVPGAFDRVVITNSYLTRDEYEVFLRLPHRTVLKHRWLLDLDGQPYGVDAYLGDLDGLIIAEREFDSSEQLAGPLQLPFEGVEITDRIDFTGGVLAGRSFAQLRDLVRSILSD